MSEMHTLYCSECDNETDHIRMPGGTTDIWCVYCKTVTMHETRKELFCTCCGNDQTVGSFVEGDLYCPICREGTEHSEYLFDKPDTEEMKYTYECDKCGHEIKRDEDTYNIIDECSHCKQWTNYSKVSKQNMGRKKHRRRNHREEEHAFFCQDCNHEIEVKGNNKRTVAIWRYCRECKKQTEFKQEKADHSIPEDILKKHFRIFPLLGALEEEKIREEGEVHETV